MYKLWQRSQHQITHKNAKNLKQKKRRKDIRTITLLGEEAKNLLIEESSERNYEFMKISSLNFH